LKQHLIDLRDMVRRLKREKDPRVLTELQAYKAWNQELLQKKAWTDDLIKRKDMQIEVLLTKDAENSAAINQLRVKQKKLEGEKFVLKCVLVVALFAMFVKLLS
jgi:hypothetical protein